MCALIKHLSGALALDVLPHIRLYHYIYTKYRESTSKPHDVIPQAGIDTTRQILEKLLNHIENSRKEQIIYRTEILLANKTNTSFDYLFTDLFYGKQANK